MKYKVGDRVKVKNESDFCEEYRGEQFVIEECDSSDDTYFCHLITGGYGIWFSEEKLEPLAPTLAEIKEKKLTCVIHTKSKAEAKILIEYMPQKDWKWNNPLDVWDMYAEETGYYIEDGQVFQFSPVSFYKDKYPFYGKVYEFSDLFVEGSIATLKPRDVSVSFASAPYLDLSSLILSTNSREFEEEINKEFNKELAEHFNAFPNDGISAKNGGKNSIKFTFYVTEGTRVDKSCNGTIPTMTTMVSYIDKYGCIMKGTATCDKTDYDERQGVLEAFANATCGNDFYKAYAEAVKEKKHRDIADRTCTYCGKVCDTIEDKNEHEAWHVECRKARHERYLLRKRAKEIAFEEAAQKLAKEIIAEDNKK